MGAEPIALADLEEHEDRWELIRLPGRKLDRVEVGRGSTRFHFDYEPGDPPSDERPWYVNVECPLVLRTAGGAEQSIDASRAASRLAPTLDLLGERVRGATVWLDGRLELRFESGAAIEVPPDPSFESWQVSGPDGLLIVCTPGGGEPALWPGGADQAHATFEEISRFDHLTVADARAEAAAAEERVRAGAQSLPADEAWIELLAAMEAAGAERLGDLEPISGTSWAIRLAHLSRPDVSDD